MPKQITITAYEYQELSEKAKRNANALVNNECFWSNDIVKSYGALYEYVAKKINGGEKASDIIADLEAKKDACAFTGYCADFDAAEDAIAMITEDDDGVGYLPARRFDIAKNACIDREWLDQSTDENTAEHCKCNGYLFNVYGEFVHHLETK